MPAFTYLRNLAGVLTETFGATTGGAPDADKIPALDAAGRLALLRIDRLASGKHNIDL